MTPVAIVAVSQPRVDNINTAEEFIAYAARVSNPQNQTNCETAERLLKYLIKHQHWSPFEMVHITMEINTTRDIARQILRHRSFSFQEFSQRYADASQLGFVTRETRKQDLKNRQNSIEMESESFMDLELQGWFEEVQNEVLQHITTAYESALARGIAKEQARSILPEGLTLSRMYMAGSLRSWIHYCQLRTGIETQKEHRVIATLCWEQILKEFPSLKTLLTLETTDV
jgi:thymidylate synthase (FAD)